MFGNARKLGQFILPFKSHVIFILVSGFVLGIVGVFPTIVIGLLTNALEQKDLAQKIPQFVISWFHLFFTAENVATFLASHKLQLKVAALGFPVVFFIVGIVRYYNYYRTRYFAEIVSNELRVALLNRIVSLNYHFFSKRTTNI